MKFQDNGNTFEHFPFFQSALFTHSEDTALADPKITNNLFLVYKTAMRVQSSMSTYADLGRLIDAGKQGLIGAASDWNPFSELDFSIYARHRIRGAILDYLRSEKQTSPAQPELHNTFVREFEPKTATRPEKSVVTLSTASFAAVRVPV